MGEMQKQTLLRKSSDSSAAAGSAVERGLPLAFARAAEESLELPLQIVSAKTRVLLLDDLQDTLDETGLYLILEGPDGATGAAVLSTEALSAFLEHLTMGRVLGKPPSAIRVPTAVDAALVSPILDDLLTECDLAFQALDADDWPPEHRFGSMIEDRRTLILSLAARGFSLFDLDLSFTGGAATGRLQLLLPNAQALQADENSEEQQIQRAELFRENVMMAPAEMRAVLTRVTMPFDQLQKLAPGDVLKIPASALTETVLEVQQGDEMARAVLGQINGQRAVRIVLPLDQQPAEFEEQPDSAPQLQAVPAAAPAEPETAAPAADPPALPAQPPATIDDFDIDLDDLDKLAQA